MNLFTSAEVQVPLKVTTTKPRIDTSQGEDLLDSITAHFDIHQQLAMALQTLDRKALNMLLAKNQGSSIWKTKTEFINLFIGWCNRRKRKHDLFITTYPGGCTGNGCGFKHSSGLSVSVNSVLNNKPLWQFSLIYRIEGNGKIVMRQCHYFNIDKSHVS